MELPGKLPQGNNATSCSMMLQPVGVIKSKIKEPFLAATDDGIKMQGEIDAVRKKIRQAQEEISDIIINPHLLDILDGIEQYSHLIVLYWAHKVPEQGRSLVKVHPMGRKEFSQVGIFCTCSPARPNPVLMCVVKLCGRQENVLQVTGLDAIDGSPVVDIKPYVRRFYPEEEILIPEWMQRLHQEIDAGDR
ncbi:tRNA (N6-threonylcarbamoyladenosine(37)-N6)-methyltransferase TrmO [Desulfobacca acetoxidans]